MFDDSGGHRSLAVIWDGIHKAM